MDIGILEQAGFPAQSLDDWRKLATKALKGADFASTLQARSVDGLLIEPLYARKTADRLITRQNPQMPWVIGQRIDDDQADRAVLQIADDLANGATGLSVVLADSDAAHGTGISLATAKSLLQTLPASASLASLTIEASKPADAHALASLALDHSPALALQAGLNAFSGLQTETALSALPGLFQSLDARMTGGTILVADARFAHNCGATEAQELALLAASLADYLRVLGAAGVAPETVFQRTSLALSLDQNQYLGLAKIRAARLIIARMQSAMGIAPVAPRISAESSWRMLTVLDPETNILRNTMAAFVAGIGGADSVTVLPHTVSHGLPEALARRLARNTQIVLMAECHLDFVADPSAGSGAIEALTDALAEKAWEIFRDIERQGGLAAALASGLVQAMIRKVAAERPTTPIVGTTLFPAKTERPVLTLAPLTETSRPPEALHPQRLDAIIKKDQI